MRRVRCRQLVAVLFLSGCSAITVDVGEGTGEVWMAQPFEWGDRCESVVATDDDRPLVLSWLEEEGVHPVAVERRAGVVSETSCRTHRETVYVKVRGEDVERLDSMGFTVRMPPAR